MTDMTTEPAAFASLAADILKAVAETADQEGPLTGDQIRNSIPTLVAMMSESAHDPVAVSDHCPECGESEPECVCDEHHYGCIQAHHEDKAEATARRDFILAMLRHPTPTPAVPAGVRESFERWAPTAGMLIDRDEAGKYEQAMTRHYWLVWQAAKADSARSAAVVIDPESLADLLAGKREHAPVYRPKADWQGGVPLFVSPVPEGWMLFPKEAWEFLRGIGELAGKSFGDDVCDDKTGRKKPYWWRSHIEQMLKSAPTAEESSVDASEPVYRLTIRDDRSDVIDACPALLDLDPGHYELHARPESAEGDSK